MDHEFELAFVLLDEAADRLAHQRYGITRIPVHDYGPIQLTTVHRYSRDTGHHLVLLAADDYGQLVAVEAAAPDLATDPVTRIRKVRAGDLTFHDVPGTWSFRAKGHHHTYALDAAIGGPAWTLRIDNAHRGTYAHIDDALAGVLDDHRAAA